MRIALVNPPSPFLTNERVMPNIGIVRVATQLKQKGFNVDIHDFAGRKPEEIRKISREYSLYGFSSTTPQMPQTMKLFNLLKQDNPNARTVLGGPHASAISQLRQKGKKDINIDSLNVFDTIFSGEAEGVNFYNMFLPGWQVGDLVKNLDELPIPDRSLIDLKSYSFKLNGQDATTIQTQRGCPFKCEFCCGRDMDMYNKMRQHSPERVVKELDQLHDKYGYLNFMWYDDEVNVNTARLEELCNVLSTRPYNHRGFVRSDLITKHPESVDWLKKAGFVKLCTGVESGSDRILKVIKKGVTTEQNYEAARLITEAGIHYEAFMIVGHPSETIEDVRKTAEWLKRANPNDFDINILTAYPGCTIYDNAVESDKHKGYNWEHKGLYFNKPDYSKDASFYKGINAQSASFTRTDGLTEKQIHKLRDEIQSLNEN